MQEFFKLMAAGLSPIPLKEHAKRPAISEWQRFCSIQANEETVAEWKKKYNLDHIGLALGTEIEKDTFLVAIDVDSDDLIENVWAAIGVRTAPAKVGKKGVTIFCKAGSAIINTKIKRRDKDGKAEKLPSVEILCHGSQTVIPPSIHPDTNKPYRWVTKNILDGFPANLPMLDEAMVDEITAICHGRAEKLLALNEMTWLGEGKGGDTHDTCVVAAAWMVSRSWSDQAIHKRIERAKLEACARAGQEYNWPHSGKAIQEWIDSAREKGMTDSSKPKKVPPERVMANWAIDELGGAENVACVDGTLRSYKDGHWPAVNEHWLQKQMYAVQDTLKRSDAENACKILAVTTSRDYFGCTADVEPKYDPKRQRLCMMNGTLNLRTGELEKHDREHEVLHKLNFHWEDDAKCPLYEQVLKTTFDGNQKAMDLWDEWCALSLVPDNSFQKILFLKGPGGNGKGTLATVLRNMHDPAAVSSVGITDLNDERKRTSLVGKLINISGEQSRLNLVSDTYLKKITGGDPIDIRLLFKEVKNNVILTVRFLELVNDMPQTSDTGDSIKRRFMILDCPVKITNPDPELGKKLYAERPGILRRWVAALERLYERGRFDIPQESVDAVDEYLMENDPVKTWFAERCEPCKDKDAGTATKELYADFRNWSEDNGYRQPYTNVYWGSKMKNIGFPPVTERVGALSVRVRRVKVKSGMKLPV